MDHMNVNSSSAPAPPLTAEAALSFQEGINLLFSRWTAVQMAVLNEWGGPHSRLKSQQLALDLFSLFTQSKEKIYIDDVEDFLYKKLDEELGTEIADGSIEEVAEELMFMHEGCLEGDFSLIQRLKAAEPPKNAVKHIAQGSSDSDDDDDDNEGGHDNSGNCDSSMMVVDVPQSHSRDHTAKMMIDESSRPQTPTAEDGWTVVASKRNKGKRN